MRVQCTREWGVEKWSLGSNHGWIDHKVDRYQSDSSLDWGGRRKRVIRGGVESGFC